MHTFTSLGALTVQGGNISLCLQDLFIDLEILVSNYNFIVLVFVFFLVIWP